MKKDQDQPINKPTEQTQNAQSTAGDTLLDAARARAGRGLPAESATLQIDQHWQNPPNQSSLEVCYRYDPKTGSHQVVIDGDEGAVVSLDDPIQLLPVEIEKPWGREIWFTGIEARGESRVVLADRSLGLGTYLALAPEHLTSGQTPVLLKILDPLATPILGELYLEVHESKQEVYVVTAIDPHAWPAGQGRIRYGINQAKRRDFADDKGFRTAFLQALQAYEEFRRRVDAGESGLAAQEAAARSACLTFTDERALEIGDVIRVPTWVPHSLQQGVRVVEFQTPTYERFILSSSQKVLTQDRWDSAHAVERMQLDAPEEPALEPVAEHCQRIVQFDEFGVWQARLPEGACMTLPATAPYAVAFCITGQIHLAGPHAGLALSAGEAALIPRAAVGREIAASEEALLLLAAPAL